MYRVLDLFSGIGGFSLGLERTGGFQTIAFCEIEPFPRAVLAKHWPAVMCFHDVRLLNRRVLEMFDLEPDVICGGFPCQDISLAGKGAGLAGARSGLWGEFRRLIEEIRPAYAIIENVSALRARGLEVVLGELAALGYDAEWHCIPASAVGTPHRRDRIWIVAYPNGEGKHDGTFDAEVGSAPEFVSNAKRDQLRQQPGRCSWPDGAGATQLGVNGEAQHVADADITEPQERRQSQLLVQLPAATGSGWWLIEPDVGRVADGVPGRVDRLQSLGNAVVPQIPEIIGKAILAHGT